ncbi:MAG: hypothetical protein POH28_05840 [Acidocella sp.]|nr:hypothetical protein [Acidocella sp.]
MKTTADETIGQLNRMVSMPANAALVLGVLPLAMTAGILVPDHAAAQTVLGTDQNASVDLANYPANVAVSITAGTTIAPLAGNGLYGAAGDIANAGFILSGGTGIMLTSGGTLSNAVLGRISASGYGVLIQGHAGQVSNAGLIAAGFDGISLDAGGTTVNEEGGTISAVHIGVYIANGGASLTNGGVILATSGDAVSLYTGGNVTNLASGRLVGGYTGIYVGGTGASILNAGIVSGPDFGVYLGGADQVNNAGTITGGIDGLVGVVAGAAIDNTGEIDGGNIGVRLFGAGSLQNGGTISGGNTGVRLANGGTLTNLAGGLVEGSSIGLQAGDNVVVNNAGSILDNHLAGAVLGGGDRLQNTGSIAGVTGILVTGDNTMIDNSGVIASSQVGGDAISFQGNADSLILGTGAALTGAIAASGANDQITLSGSGQLSSDITGFGDQGAVNVAPGADWTASGQWDVQNVTNDGTLQPGIIGVPLALTGNFTQHAGGTMLVYVTPTASTQFSIMGNVTLAGRLVYILAPGSYAPVTEGFLSATGGVAGAFSAVSSTEISGTAAPASPSADMAAPVPVAAPVAPASPQALSPASPQAPAALPATSSVSAPVLAPVGLAVVALSQSVALVVANSFTVSPPDDALFAEADQAAASSAGRSSEQILDHAVPGAAPSCAPHVAAPYGLGQAAMAASLAGAFCRAGGWIEASQADLHVNGSYTSQDPGVLAGIDRQVGVNGARIGVVIGYDTLALHDVQAGTARIGTVRFGLYGSQPLGGLVLAGDIQEGFLRQTTTRATGAGNASGQASGHEFAGAMRLAMPLSSGPWALSPSAGVRLAQTSMSGMREQAAQPGFALSSAATREFTALADLRMNISRKFVTGSGILVAPSADIGLDYQMGGNWRTDMLAADGTAFSAAPVGLEPLAGEVGVRLAASQGRFTFSAGYDAAVAGNWHAQEVHANMSMAF